MLNPLVTPSPVHHELYFQSLLFWYSFLQSSAPFCQSCLAQFAFLAWWHLLLAGLPCLSLLTSAYQQLHLLAFIQSFPTLYCITHSFSSPCRRSHTWPPQPCFPWQLFTATQLPPPGGLLGQPLTLNSYDSSMMTSSLGCSPSIGLPISAILLASSSSTVSFLSATSAKARPTLSCRQQLPCSSLQ